MRLPFLQVHQTAFARVKLLAPVLGVDRQKALGIALDLWAWALELAPEDATPEDIGVFEDASPGETLAGAVEWTGDAGKLVRGFERAGFVALTATGFRVRGLSEIYGDLLAERAADRERKRRARAERQQGRELANPLDHVSSGRPPDKDRTSAGRPEDSTRQTQTQTQTHIQINDDPPPPAADPHGFFARFQAARVARLGAVSERLKKPHKKRDEPAEWRALYQQRLEQLGGDEAALWRVFEAYLGDTWGLSRDPPCTWHGLKSDEVFDRCAAVRPKATGPPAPPCAKCDTPDRTSPVWGHSLCTPCFDAVMRTNPKSAADVAAWIGATDAA